ncbi:hypothetical protein TNCV_1927531 [Trichonephila clavipes]|nr:hypothetical protein TNCV_1927531 [Trichonephila clavipes]
MYGEEVMFRQMVDRWCCMFTERMRNVKDEVNIPLHRQMKTTSPDSIIKLWRWRSVVSPSIVPSANFAELIRSVTCIVLKANDRRTSSPLPGWNFVCLDLTTSDRWH